MAEKAKSDLQKLTRTRSLELQEGEEERVLRFPIASDEAVPMGYCKEILSHAPGAMRMGERQKSMPLLFNHDWDRLCGVVEKLEQDEHRTYVTVRFANTEDGNEVFGLVKDRILTNVSCGYVVNDSLYDDATQTRTVRDWELYEVSLVTVPADPTVGVYRSLNLEDKNMDETMKKEDQAPQMAPAAQQANDTEVRQSALREASVRVMEITGLCRDFKINDGERDEYIMSDKSLDEVRSAILQKIRSRGAAPVASSERGVQKEMKLDLGLTQREAKRYSLLRALNACVTGRWDAAGFERELSQEIAQRMGRDSNGFFMPTDIPFAGEQRDYTVGTAGNGGNLVATDLLGGSFIEALRNSMAITQLGATFLTGLQGNVEIPRQSGVASTQWISETGTVTASNATFDKVALKMKTIAAKSFLSRNFLMQTSIDAENFARMELLKSVALAVDLAALSGTGEDGQPLGLANQPGVLSISGGDNGSAVTFDDLIEMETQVANANADANAMAYLANAVTIGALKKLKDSNGAYLWKSVDQAARNAVPGEINGYSVARSNQVRRNLKKGTGTNLSEMFSATG